MKGSAIERARRKAAKQAARIRQLEAENAGLRAEHAELKAKLEKLERLVAALRKDSSTSSKPPSSDIVKPPKKDAKNGKKRKIGGQPGHPRHERPPFPPEEIDQAFDFYFEHCPCCGDKLLPYDCAPRVLQQVELVEKPIRIFEYRGQAGWCGSCEKVHYAPLPDELRKAGLIGPRLTSLIAYLKGMCHASFSTVRKFLRDVVGLTISRGQIEKLITKASESLIPAYEELRNRLPLEVRLNVDETGHKENGDKFWTWCFRAELYTLFRIDKSRGSGVLIDVLGEEFDGVLGCDYFSAYRKFMGDFDVRVQFCLAHLIRDIKFLLKLDPVSKNFGNRLLEKVRALFRVIHRRETMTPEKFQARLEKVRDEILKIGKRAPPRIEAQNIADRFRKHGKAYFEFITTPGIAPTNNLAEQAIRFVVIDRKITQGTRGLSGREWCERIWTAVATCTQQGRSVFEFLHETVSASFEGRPPPSLLPDTS